jgi:splicing factor 3B subunit 2
MGGLSTAEKNKRKRERKKREREEHKQQEEQAAKAAAEATPAKDAAIEIEYVAEPVQLSADVEGLRKFQELLMPMNGTSEDQYMVGENSEAVVVEDYEEDDGDGKPMSKRKLRDMMRPSVADLKRRVEHPELVEAHDVTAPDPEFLVELKGLPGTVPVPRHWGRKRKYLQGKVRFWLRLFYSESEFSSNASHCREDSRSHLSSYPTLS